VHLPFGGTKDLATATAKDASALDLFSEWKSTVDYKGRRSAPDRHR
jgi:hypothetical protein